jgi:hypothetical protein
MTPRHENSRIDAGSVPSVSVRKRYDDKVSMLTLKIEADLKADLDAEVLRASIAAGHVITRSDVVKALLREALTARPVWCGVSRGAVETARPSRRNLGGSRRRGGEKLLS